MINHAYETAREAHRHQSRGSGESYINHPLAVARIVADIGLDEISLAAALLHDAVEDTEITIANVEPIGDAPLPERFGGRLGCSLVMHAPSDVAG